MYSIFLGSLGGSLQTFPSSTCSALVWKHSGHSFRCRALHLVLRSSDNCLMDKHKTSLVMILKCNEMHTYLCSWHFEAVHFWIDGISSYPIRKRQGFNDNFNELAVSNKKSRVCYSEMQPPRVLKVTIHNKNTVGFCMFFLLFSTQSKGRWIACLPRTSLRWSSTSGPKNRYHPVTKKHWKDQFEMKVHIVDWVSTKKNSAFGWCWFWNSLNIILVTIIYTAFLSLPCIEIGFQRIK